MLTMAKQHGSEAHFMRPEVTYRTSVIFPTAGYAPVEASQANAARFVAPMGLAGTRFTRHLGDAQVPLASRWTMFVAGIKARWQAGKIYRAVRRGAIPMAPGNQTQTIDTSPRPPSSDASAIAVQGGWAPAPQTPASAVAYATNDPIMSGKVAVGVAMDPMASFPATYWRDVISQDVPPIIAARGGGDLVNRWYRRKGPF